MRAEYSQLTDKQKLALMRAFLMIKQNDQLLPVLEFLGFCDQEAARRLRTLPLDQIQREQGVAQTLSALIELAEMAGEAEITRLRQATGN